MRRSAATLFTGALVGLGVAASALLLFSQTVQMLRVGLVVALWTAVLGAIAMSRYRRESAAARVELDDLQKIYELELDKEIAARREFEAGVETKVRKELDGGDVVALRAELTALRTGLERLLDGGLPVERVALRAEVTRVQELTTTSFSKFQPSASGLLVPDARPPAPQFADGPARPSFAGPDDAPVTAETAVLSMHAESADGAVTVEEDTAEPAEGAQDAAVEPDAADDSLLNRAFAAIDMGHPRRRRRVRTVDESSTGSHTEGLSVAEIMANLQAERADAERTTASA